MIHPDYIQYSNYINQRNNMVTVVSTVPHASVIKETVCRNCGATLQYTPSDIKEDYSTDYTGGKDYYKFIKCPPCGHEVHVKGY